MRARIATQTTRLLMCGTVLPRPVFPEGTLAEVLEAIELSPLYYVVTKGFCIGVYTTWVNGAENVVNHAPGNAHFKMSTGHFWQACAVLSLAVERGVGYVIPFVFS
jgi:hypothetical protein